MHQSKTSHQIPDVLNRQPNLNVKSILKYSETLWRNLHLKTFLHFKSLLIWHFYPFHTYSIFIQFLFPLYFKHQIQEIGKTGTTLPGSPGFFLKKKWCSQDEAITWELSKELTQASCHFLIPSMIKSLYKWGILHYGLQMLKGKATNATVLFIAIYRHNRDHEK